jgi:Secretion system C-terminal sorting domain
MACQWSMKGESKKIKMKKFYPLVVLLAMSFLTMKTSAQSFLWTGYTAGATSYSEISGGGATMSVSASGTGLSAGYPVYSSSYGGFLATTVDWSNTTSSVTYTITFSSPLPGVSFPLYDVDQTSSWDDKVTISAKNYLNTNVYPTITGNAYSTVSGSNKNIIEGNANNATFSNAPANVSFGATPIKSITIVYSAGANSPSNPASQVIGFGAVSFWSILPIDLLSFKAEKKNTAVELKWEAENQLNFSHFEVERSSTATGSFTKIGSVQSSAATTGNYSFTDATAARYMENAYYRLKMIDIDGTFKYSPITMIHFDNTATFSIKPSLLSAGEAITVFISGNGQVKADVKLFDMSGKMIAQKNQVYGQVQLETASLKKGMYIINVSNGITTQTFRAVVQ